MASRSEQTRPSRVPWKWYGWLYDWYRWPLIRSAWGLYWEMRGYYDTGRRYCGQPRRKALPDTLINGWRRPR